jgi:hypothetical protein
MLHSKWQKREMVQKDKEGSQYSQNCTSSLFTHFIKQLIQFNQYEMYSTFFTGIINPIL